MAYATGDKIIKQIKTDASNTFEIDAKYWNGHTFDELKNIKFIISNIASNTPAGVKFTPKDSSTQITGTLAAKDADFQAIYLVYSPNDDTDDKYDEYVSIGNTTAATWEKIGSTSVDLSSFAKKGEYTTLGPSTNSTSEADLGTATGTATVTYKKSATATGSSGATGTSANTGSAGGATVTGTAEVSYLKPNANTGNAGGTTTANTGSAGGEVDYSNFVVGYSKPGNAESAGAHTHSVSGTVSYSGTTGATKKGVKVTTAACGDTEKGTVGFTAASLGTPDTATVVTGVTGASASGTTTVITGYPNFSGGSATGTFVTGVKSNASVGGDRNFGFTASTSNVMTAPTVSAAGVLSWTLVDASKQDAHTMTQMTFNTATVGWTAASLGTASTVSVVTGVTGGTASGTTSAVTGYSKFSGGSLTGTKTFVTSAIKSASLAEDTATTPAFAFNTDAIKGLTGLSFSSGVAASAGAHTHSVELNDGTAILSGTLSMASHSHTYVELKQHSHGIGTTSATASGTATVTIADHSHSYTKPADHTHSIALSDATVTGTASVAVGKHSHTMGNHTHNFTL